MLLQDDISLCKVEEPAEAVNFIRQFCFVGVERCSDISVNDLLCIHYFYLGQPQQFVKQTLSKFSPFITTSLCMAARVGPM